MKLTSTPNKAIKDYSKIILLICAFILHSSTYANVPEPLNPTETISLQNYPNPFNDRTTISYTVETYTTVELTVFNVLGSKIDVLEKKTKTPGTYSLEWNAQQVPEGIYILQLKVDNQIITKRVIKK